VKKRMFLFLGTLLLGALPVRVYGQQPISIEYRWPYSLKGEQVNVKCLLVKDGLIFAGTSGQYLWVSADTGKTWVQKNGSNGLRIDWGDIFDITVTPSGKVLAATWNGVYASTDNGNNWQRVSSNRTIYSLFVTRSSTILAAVAPQYIDPTKIWRSSDDGLTWFPVADTTPVAALGGFTQTPSGVIVVGSGGPYLGDGAGVLRSLDDGQTWSVSSLGLSGWAKNTTGKLAANPTGSSREVYMTSYLSGAFKSDDDGLSWTHIDEITEIWGGTAGVFPPLGVFIAVRGSVNGSWQRSLYRSQGKGWERISPKLFNDYIILSLAQFGDNQILVGTHDGMFLVTFDMPTAVQSEPSIPTAFELKQNYPNPFNPSTTLAFSLPSKSFVSLKVFDALGREVAILVSEELPAGTYVRQWSATGLPSGAYFYRLQAGEFIETKKLILVR
jgi:photosystem II stability/assembly factor-like uncharacterized protein